MQTAACACNSFLRQMGCAVCRAGLTKMVSKLSREGSYRKGLEVFEALPAVGLIPDTAITNAAISACDKGAHTMAYSPRKLRNQSRIPS